MRVVVIGAGLMGVSTAYFLAEDGHEVTVLDRETDVALGASFANGALLTPSMADPWNAPGVWRLLLKYLGKEDSPLLLRPKAIPSLAFWGIEFLRNSAPDRFRRATAANERICSYSVALLKSLERSLGLDYDQGPGGVLKFCRDAKGVETMVGVSRELQKLGLPIDMLDGAGAVAREPALAPIEKEIAGALFIPVDESGDARKYTLGLAAAAKARGVAFEFGVSVTGFERAGGRITTVVAANSSRSALRYKADAVVIAAGSWSPALTGQFGIRLPVKPVKGYSITTPRNGWNDGPRVPVVDDSLHAVVTPLGDRLRVAGTAEFTGFDKTMTQSRIDNLVTFLTALYPQFAPHFDRANIAPWCGFRPMSADGVPFIGQVHGRSKVENLFLNVGQGHLGWTMSTGSGRLLADLIGGKTPAIDPAAYNPNR